MNRSPLHLSLAAAAALLLAACATPAAAPTASVVPSTTPSAAASASAARSAAASATGDADSALMALIRAHSTSYKVSYQFTAAGQTGTGTITQYVKAPYFRQDMAMPGVPTTFSTYVRPEGTFMCGAMTGSPACYSTGAGAATPPEPHGPETLPQDLSGWNIVPSGTKTVAGQTTRCYSFSGAAAAGAQLTGCYTTDGIPLYMMTSAGGAQTEITATSFSKSVADADFTLPYAVQKLPGMP
ncbi:MAG: hypothetical protein KGN00_06290 [Chloroflexota bacterium]|nr:hypothetical protein [Chloroflexota bacterium]